MTDELQITMCLEDEPEIVYPSSSEDVPEIDGLRMEPVYSEVQQALIAHFGSRNDVLVAGNNFIYFKEDGHPERTWLDCFVAFGVDRDAIRSRGQYHTWKTGKAPDFVLELRTSMGDSPVDGESSWRLRLHAALGITEYWIVDTAGAGSDRRGLRGNRLVDGRYEQDGARHRSRRRRTRIQPDAWPQPVSGRRQAAAPRFDGRELRAQRHRGTRSAPRRRSRESTATTAIAARESGVWMIARMTRRPLRREPPPPGRRIRGTIAPVSNYGGSDGFGVHSSARRRVSSYAVSVSGNWRVTFRFEEDWAVDVDYVDYH